MSPYKQLSIRYTVHSTRLSLLVGLFLLVFIGGTVGAATIGVGVGTGRIVLDEPIKPSLSYPLPSIAVFNNGDVESDYEMSVEFNETQPELKPDKQWIVFSPRRFTLQPGKAQQVAITIEPAYSAVPGNYFAYLEAHPLKKDQTGQTAIKVAAATKFSFKIVPANTWQRFYYALLDFWNKHRTVIILITGALLIAIVILLGKKYLKIELKRKS